MRKSGKIKRGLSPFNGLSFMQRVPQDKRDRLLEAAWAVKKADPNVKRSEGSH
jgi:hypothetical protein